MQIGESVRKIVAEPLEPPLDKTEIAPNDPFTQPEPQPETEPATK